MNDFILLIKKNKFLFNLFLWIKFSLFSCYYFVFFTIFKLFPINKRKIIILNYNGKGYGDMGKYICNELLGKDYKIIWTTNNKNSLPDGVSSVKLDSIPYIYHLSTSKIWINNSRFRFGTQKRKDQFYIQAWHGCVGYKKVEQSAVNVLTKPYIYGAKNDSKMADLFISNGTYCSNVYRRDFWYDGEILECGCPRNDIIVNNDYGVISKVKEYYNLQDDYKICLYAPTFRVDNSFEHYNVNFDLLYNSLSNKFGGKWKILIRLHPNISQYAYKITRLSNNIINATDYPDMQELLVAANFMITDYSSCIFDYGLSYKPAMIFASDIEEYTKDRNFAIKIEDTPFPLATNNDELVHVISNFDEKRYKKKVKTFYDDLGVKEPGDSSKTIANYIDKICKNEGK